MTEFQVAVGHFQSGNLQQAENLLKKIQDNPDAFFVLGLICARQGRLDEAIERYRQAVALKPDVADFYSQLGMACAQTNRLDDAIQHFREAVRLQPELAACHNNLGTALKDRGDLDQAAAAFEIAVRLKPDYALAHNNLGNVLHAQGKRDAAAQCFRNALAIDPNFIDARNNLGDVLEAQGRLDDAAACYLAVLAAGTPDMRACNNLANVYRTQGKFNEAVALFQQAQAIDPNVAETHSNLGYAYFCQGRLGEAEMCFRMALKLKPDLAVVHHNLGAALNGLGRSEEALVSITKALELQPDYADAFSTLLFVSQFTSSISREALLEEHLRFAERFETPLKASCRPHANARDANKRIKIGYVSADFRSHAVAAFMQPILASHDASVFEIFCYYNHAQCDRVTERMQSLVHHWMPCVAMNDEQLAERIRADGIDVLVDLSGHTGGNRMLTFARKPAPVQMTYLGYPGTSGLSTMDYRITDRRADPDGSDRFYSERLLRLPDGLCCYQPMVEMPEVLPSPALINGFLTFGSFNKSNKIDLPTIALWARLLCAVPSSRLVMVTIPEGERREWITRQFEAAGVARSRIDFHASLPAREFHNLMGQVDIALDPLLVTGGTTTCESFWMGVPVIVLVGEDYIHRVGYSFLCSAGLTQFAAMTQDDYIRIGVEAAADIPRLAQLRASMRTQVATSPLMDKTRFTRNLENAYRQAWKHWCENAA
ncbi:MAG: tetratricopeptide repeat protein [Burkholderiales bacterium]|nr:tetratricopeptide repeat protein [Burkholderiales bacterium]